MMYEKHFQNLLSISDISSSLAASMALGKVFVDLSILDNEKVVSICDILNNKTIVDYDKVVYYVERFKGFTSKIHYAPPPYDDKKKDILYLFHWYDFFSDEDTTYLKENLRVFMRAYKTYYSTVYNILEQQQTNNTE